MSLGRGDPRHGTLGGYANHRCKCPACKKAGQDYRNRRNDNVRRKATAEAAAVARLKKAHAVEYSVMFAEELRRTGIES